MQRGNAEIERRAQEVIDRCCALGERNPILSIHDVGAGGLSNAVPELVHSAGRGGLFDLRKVPNEEPGMSPMQIWCNEAQERYVLAIAPETLPAFEAICERERCPFAVLGRATGDGRLSVEDPLFGNKPVDMELAVLLGKPPKMRRDVRRVKRALPAFDASGIDLHEAALRVLRLPCVADKTFLVSIGDRSVGGLTARDQMVGPWQVPVADVAVTAMGYRTYRGEAFAMGERTPLAVIDPEAAGRMAVGEAITNLAAAPVAAIGDVKLSANWMAAAGHAGEDAALYDTVRSVALELCPALGVSIPVGKDSLSMKTTWQDAAGACEVASPLSLIVSAFAPVTDVRRTLTPQLRVDCGESVLVLIDLGGGEARLGGSALAQVYGQTGSETPDVDDPRRLSALFGVIQALNGEGKLLAYHDRSDGGLFATVCEMMFAGRTGLALEPERGLSVTEAAANLSWLFNEELGAIVQVRSGDLAGVLSACESAGLGECTQAIGRVTNDGRLTIVAHDDSPPRPVHGGAERSGRAGVRGGIEIYSATRVELHRAWSETTYHMQRLRDHPECAQQEFDRILDERDPGLHAVLTFDPDDAAERSPAEATASTNPSPRGRGAGVRESRRVDPRPRIAILREQGVNGQMEMAAAFDRAGFHAIDVHMSDIIAGRVTLREFAGFAACGGFSYGDVLGAGEGWAKSILFNARARERVHSVLRAPRYVRARRVQRLPDDEQSARHHSGRGALAAFRSQQVGTVRGARGDARGFALAVDVLSGDGGEPHPDRCRARRRLCRVQRCAGACRSRAARRIALRRQLRPAHRDLSVQPQRFAARHHRAYHAGRAIHHRDAASRTRVQDGQLLMASGRLGRRRAVDEDIQECAAVRGLGRREVRLHFFAAPSAGFVVGLSSIFALALSSATAFCTIEPCIICWSCGFASSKLGIFDARSSSSRMM